MDLPNNSMYYSNRVVYGLKYIYCMPNSKVVIYDRFDSHEQHIINPIYQLIVIKIEILNQTSKGRVS